VKQAAYRSATTRMERSSNFELYAWFFMRVSGIALLFMALFHLYYMHFVVDVATVDFLVIAARWQSPLWRTFDLLLLLFAWTHGTNGVRYVLEDYVRHPGLRVATKTGLYLLFGALLVMGAYVIFAFDSELWLAREAMRGLTIPAS
jgi:succinate dehydrogenase / fumarate reductase, membrane anchor subunit